MSAVSGIITNPTAQKLLNLGIPAKYIKAAGPAGLAAMGIASLVDLARKSQKEFDQLSPEKQAKYLREQEEFAESVNKNNLVQMIKRLTTTIHLKRTTVSRLEY
jgi:hypothetical protein